MKRMMRYGAVVATACVVALGGCAGRHRSGDRVIVDTKGVDLNAYYQDLDDCQHYADDVEVGRRAASGAVAGAVIGGAVGAIATGSSRTTTRAAGVGGLVGGAKGASSGVRERDRVVKNCLAGRGYRVLN